MLLQELFAQNVTVQIPKKCCIHINKKNTSQRYQCKQCCRTFTPNGQDFFVSEEKRQYIYNSLGGRSNLAGISSNF
jgi:transposase-like protein